jgi:hypothetical protein
MILPRRFWYGRRFCGDANDREVRIEERKRKRTTRKVKQICVTFVEMLESNGLDRYLYAASARFLSGGRDRMEDPISEDEYQYRYRYVMEL